MHERAEGEDEAEVKTINKLLPEDLRLYKLPAHLHLYRSAGPMSIKIKMSSNLKIPYQRPRYSYFSCPAIKPPTLTLLNDGSPRRHAVRGFR